MAVREIDAERLREVGEPTARIKRLREATLDNPPPAPWELELHRGEGFRATAGELWWIVRRGRQVAHVLRNIDVVIDPDDLLLGRPTRRDPTDDERQRLDEARAYMAAQPRAAGQAGHMAPHFESLLRLGCRGVQEKIRRLAERLDPADPSSPPKLAFYKAAHEALDGLIALAQRYADEAERLAEAEADPARAAELRELAAICRRVPEHPARTFHEALQAAHLLLFALNYGEGCVLSSPGSIDRWLWPYLQADLAAGRITVDRAQELLDAFFLSFNHYIGRGLAIGMLVGGRDADGRDVTNPLTWMALRAAAHVRLAYPTLGLRVHSGTDPALVDMALEILADGTGNPALFNDEVITDGLLAAGLPRADACDYMNSTCVEITPCGKSNVWVASPYINLPAILLEIIRDVASGRLAAPASFDALMAEYKRRLVDRIAKAVAEQNNYRYAAMAHRNFPLASCFVLDCIDRGLDMDWGGARYNWVEASFVGLATVTDSLAAVRKFVIERGELTWSALHEMLAANFAGHEAWRRRLITHAPKYGNAIADVDGIAREIMEFATAQCRRHRVVFGAGYHPGLFAWVMHGRMGEQTGATPDGRLAGTAISPGPDPVGGRARSGPTAAVLSATVFDHRPLLGGVAYNLRFSRTMLADASRREKIAALLRAYFRRGGAQAQITVAGADVLREAQCRPEDYADLMVRVAGFSDYFVNLSRTLQDEIIAREEIQ